MSGWWPCKQTLTMYSYPMAQARYSANCLDFQCALSQAAKAKVLPDVDRDIYTLAACPLMDF